MIASADSWPSSSVFSVCASAIWLCMSIGALERDAVCSVHDSGGRGGGGVLLVCKALSVDTASLGADGGGCFITLFATP